ncbi:MAG: DMT family transporter [Acidimicrobiales bacterium]
MVTAASSVETNHMEPRDWALLVFASSVWGASFLFTAIGLDAFSPGLVSALRVWFGAMAVWSFPGARRSVDRADWPRMAALGVTWMAFPLTLFPIAQQWIDSSLAGMLNSAMPVATTIISVVVFGAVLVPKQVVGVAVGLVGVGLIGVPTASSGGTTALGVGLVVLAVFSYGIAVNLAGPLQQRYGSTPVVARALLLAAVLVAPAGLAGVPSSTFEWGALAACAVLGAAGTGLAFVAAATLTGRVGPVRTSLVTYLIPVVAIVLGAIFRDETLTGWAAAGTAVVLAGAFLATRPAETASR